MEDRRPEISVIIPTLNEVTTLGRTLDSASNQPGVEVVVADGGSSDGTVELARQRECQVVKSPSGRSLQLNHAARHARGRLFLFLHADTELPVGFEEQVSECLGRPGVVLGAFCLRIGCPGVGLRLVEKIANLRSRWLSSPYGDQALFITRENFERLDGFREIPIMDDYDLVRRAREIGRIETLDASVTTSARRWERLGILRTTFVNWSIVVAFRFGVSAHRLAKWYRRGIRR